MYKQEPYLTKLCIVLLYNMFGYNAFATEQFGATTLKAIPAVALVDESFSIVDNVDKHITTHVIETLPVVESVQKSISKTITESLSVSDTSRIFVEGNDVTHWEREAKDSGTWSRINKQL